MTKIVFIRPDSEAVEVTAKIGDSIMHAALANQVPGILAECGGSMACATCHIYVDEEWLERLEPLSSMENEMLDATASERRSNSRLCCQIEVSDRLDGIRVRIPESQI
jgi:ferredoxin, 2Fe-2S